MKIEDRGFEDRDLHISACNSREEGSDPWRGGWGEIVIEEQEKDHCLLWRLLIE